MNNKILFLLLASILLFGCAKPPSCADPLVMIDGLCCRDDNNNSICDLEEAADEKLAMEETQEESGPVQPVESIPVEPEPKAPTSGSEKTEQPASTSSQVPSEDAAKKVANIFAQSWSSKQYNIMYSVFTDKLKKIKTAAEFTAIMELNPSFENIDKATVKGIEFTSETKGDIDFEISTNVNSYTQTDTHIIYENGEWRIDALDEVFYVDTFGASCGGYMKEFNKEECAKDLAIKLKDIKYCERSKCHYEKCITTIKGRMTKEQAVKRCDLCPPVMMNTMECVIDAAKNFDDVSVCNEIPESRYSDRYCGCYGGYAKAKNQVGYCNMISDPEYKSLCMKGFEGQRC